MNVFYREHVRGTLCEQLQLSQRITIPPVTNSYTSQAFSFFFFWELLHENGRWCAKKCFAYQPEIVQLALWQVHDQVVARITYLLELAVLTRCYFELTSFYVFGIKIHVILFDSCVFFPVFSVLFIMVARTISQLVWLCRGNVMFFLKAEIKIVKASLLLWNKIAHKGIPP